MNIMLDLETMSSRSDAAIIAIGAVAWHGDTIFQQFYVPIKPESAEKYGHISGSTFAWWCQQGDGARALFMDKAAVELPIALGNFISWMGSMTREGLDGMWGNGADFDCVVLGNAYERCGIAKPWSFRMNRCFRTLKSLVPHERANELWTKHGEGIVHHNAVHDAKRQALMAIDILKDLGR